MFSLYSQCILGVVFTPPVGYSRPPSAVNDPTVTKQMNSAKSCLEEVSQLLVYQVALFNQYMVHLHGDFQRDKESTLADSTMKKKNFVSIVGFVELPSSFSFNCRKVDNACLKSDLRCTGIVSEPILFERIHQLLL